MEHRPLGWEQLADCGAMRVVGLRLQAGQRVPQHRNAFATRRVRRGRRFNNVGTWQDRCVLILLSPAKTLDYDCGLPTRKHTEPRMLD